MTRPRTVAACRWPSALRSSAIGLGALAALLGFLGAAGSAQAQPRELEATVVWARPDRAYVAAPDSALDPGDLLTFEYRGKKIASGEVARVHDRELAVVVLTSGSLSPAKKLDRIRILAERPRLSALPVLRVGYPGRGRRNLVFACDDMSIASFLAVTDYRTESSAEDSYRLVRGPRSSIEAPWPDTLLVRLFDEPADEEIALARGELDLAVFWPGELTTHMRDDPRWRDPLSGVRSRGVIAAKGAGDLDWARLNRQIFRDDLVAWGQAARLAPLPSAGGSARPETLRYAVDRSWPGHGVVEGFLNRGLRPSASPDDGRSVRLFYVDAPIAAPESLALEVADYLGSISPEHRAQAGTLTRVIRRLAAAKEPVTVQFLEQSLRDLDASLIFAIGCPVVCEEKLRRYVKALGGDALVNLMSCPSARRRP